jgi:hypothetical protein
MNDGSGTSSFYADRIEHGDTSHPPMVSMGSKAGITLGGTWSATAFISSLSNNTNLDRSKYGIVLTVNAGSGNDLFVLPIVKLTVLYKNVSPYPLLARY